MCELIVFLVRCLFLTSSLHLENLLKKFFVAVPLFDHRHLYRDHLNSGAANLGHESRLYVGTAGRFYELVFQKTLVNFSRENEVKIELRGVRMRRIGGDPRVTMSTTVGSRAVQ